MIKPPAQDSDYAPKFSRKWWLRGVYSFAWIAVITALIWVWADLRFADTMDFRATIVLDASKASDLLASSSKTIDVTFKLEGSRASLDKFLDELRNGQSQIVYEVDLAPGEHTLLVADMLNKAKALTKSGLSLVSAGPTSTVIKIDRRIWIKDVPIEPGEVINGILAEGKPVRIEPDKTDVLVAEQDWKKICQLQPDVAKRVIQTTPLDLKDRPTGQEITLPAGLIRQIAGLPVEPKSDKEKVNVFLTAAKRINKKEFTVNIRIKCPPAWAEDGTWKDYDLVRSPLTEWRRKIEVAGTQQDLEKLKPEDIDAFVDLIDKDKDPVESWLTRDVTVRFPSELRLTVLGEPPKVMFKLVQTAKPPAAPAVVPTPQTLPEK
ncbi:MAG: hypothetical protein HZA50_16310 [Planctomycetes bacterium]|nr:hypothetical protein [Planctomycetota bacterium]